MPYMPYSKTKLDDHGKRVSKWKIRKTRCLSCGREFVTKDPYKVYCSKRCRRIEEVNRRRIKNEVKKMNEAKLITPTQEDKS